MNKLLEISEEVLKVLNFLCDVSLKHPQAGGLQAHEAVQFLKEAVAKAPEVPKVEPESVEVKG